MEGLLSTGPTPSSFLSMDPFKYNFLAFTVIRDHYSCNFLQIWLQIKPKVLAQHRYNQIEEVKFAM